jgi:hypothetical protein
MLTKANAAAAAAKTEAAEATNRAVTAEATAKHALAAAMDATARADEAEEGEATATAAAAAAVEDANVKGERIRELRAAVADALGSRADDEHSRRRLGDEVGLYKLSSVYP